MLRFALCCVGLALVTHSLAGANVTVKRVSYHGWSGAYRLSNGTVELVFVPQIGRIMRYGFVGGPNALWDNPALLGRTAKPWPDIKEWTNFGGDKVWPAPQSKWGWPPDPYLDGASQKATILPGNRLQAVTRKSPKSGVQITRVISLAPTGTRVTIVNTMENTSDQDVEWSIWEVSQANNPIYSAIPRNRAGRFHRGYYVFKDSAPPKKTVSVTGDQVRYRWIPDKGGKIGSDSPAGWALASFRNGVLFRVSARVEPGKDYPDDGCAEEVWSNPRPLPYMELELLSPIRFLQPGDRSSFVTHWTLEKRQRRAGDRMDG